MIMEIQANELSEGEPWEEQSLRLIIIKPTKTVRPDEPKVVFSILRPAGTIVEVMFLSTKTAKKLGVALIKQAQLINSEFLNGNGKKEGFTEIE